jgi:hypothetical protein
MNLKKLLAILIFLFSATSVYSQRIENVDFTVRNNIVIVQYDLVNSPSSKIYDIKLEIISNGNNIIPTSLSGDLKKVNPGTNKRIVWDVLADLTDLKGSLQIAIEITRTYSTKIAGGPSNAFLSMIMPGVGTYFVNKESRSQGYTKNWRWFSSSGLFLGSVGFAISNKIASDKFYTDYHNAVTQPEMDAAYKSANDKYLAAQIFLGIAAAVWIGDVIYVTVNGSRNKKNQLARRAANYNRVRFYVSKTPENFQLILVKKF